MPEPRGLDRTDRRILELLQNDARLSNKELAERVGLAPSTTLTRVQRLIEAGVLRGFHADVDPQAVGLALQAVVFVQFRTHDPQRVARFTDEIISHPEVVQMFYLAGAQDLVVHLVATDTGQLRDVVAERIASHAEVRHVQTHLVFEHRRAPIPM